MNDQENETAGDDLQLEGEVTVDEGSTERRRAKRRRSARPEIPVNMDELRELIGLIRENEFTEFELEREGFRVRFRRGAEIAEPGGSQSRGFGGPAAPEPVSTVSEPEELRQPLPHIPVQRRKQRRPKIRACTSSRRQSWVLSIDHRRRMRIHS